MLSIFLTVVPMEGVFLAPLQEGRDTVLIADQMLYGVEIKDVPEGTRLYFPEIQQKSPEEGGVMVLSDWQVDTLDVKRQKKGLPRLYDIRAGFVLTSFVEGEYELPPLSVERHSPEGEVDTLEFAPLTFNVSPVLIDTTSFQIHDIKGQIRYPLTFKEVLPYILGFQLLAVLVILAVCLAYGCQRKFAVKYALLLSVPAFIGSFITECTHMTGASLGWQVWAGYVAGALAAGVAGYFSIRKVTRVLQNKKFYGFSVYCFLIGAAAVAGSFYLA